MNDKTLTLLAKNTLPEKAKAEIEIAKQFKIFIDRDIYYYSKEFGLIKIYIPKPRYRGIKLNQFNVPNKIKEINISVINPDNINSFWIDPFTNCYLNSYMEELATNFEKIEGKDLSKAYVSTDCLPGYKIMANNINSVDMEGDLIYSKEYGVLFIQVLDIHESNYIKIDGIWKER